VAVDAGANEVLSPTAATTASSCSIRKPARTSAIGRVRREADAAGGGPYDPNAAPARQFRDVTCIEIAKDGMVYVCDRTSNRIQVFQKDGKFVKEGIVSKNTMGATVSGQFGVVSSWGSAWDIAFSTIRSSGTCSSRTATTRR
jgi:hypothetical protein